MKQNFYQLTMGDRFSKRELTIIDPEVRIYGEAAVAVFYWRFRARFESDGSDHVTSGRETQVLRRDHRVGWLLVHVHYSNMPVTGDREGF